jgi:hypothetical protein
MAMRLAVVVLVACASAPVATTPQAPRTKRAPYSMLAGELGDPGAIEAIPHHARLLKIGEARFVLGGDVVAPSTEDESDAVVPVLGETREAVRVVSDQDDARLALWIARSDLRETVLAPVKIEQGSAAESTGVWLEPGAAFELLEEPSGVRRRVTTRVTGIAATGYVRDAVIGTIWVGAVPRSAGNGDHVLDVGAVLRAAPNVQGPVVARVRAELSVHAIAAYGAWTLVEHVADGVRIRGYVETKELIEGIHIGGLTGAGGYGISDVDRVEVSAQACLYDRVGGEVVGVNVTARERYGFVEQGWGHVYVSTPWGLTVVLVRAAGEGAWESCARP